MTTQEAFDKMVRGLAGQGWKKAVMGGDWIHGAPKLRTNSGLKCAIGHLIPDGQYKPKMEAVMDGNLAEVLKMVGVEIEPGHGLVLDECVDAHDSAQSRLDMHQKFQAVANLYGLQFPSDCIAPEVEVEEVK